MKFYGWKIVGALFVILAFSSGLSFYNHAIIVQALAADGGFSIEVASLAVSVFFIVSGVAGLFIAPVLEQHDMRWVIAAGAMIASASLFALGKVSTNLELFMVYSTFGVGYCFTSILPSTTLIARWFEVNRARALSIASTGLSVGGIVLTPISAAFVERLGFESAMSWLALMYLLGVLPISLAVIRSSPAQMGLAPDGREVGSTAGLGGITFDAAIRHHYFWAMSLGFILIMLAQVGGIAHQFGVLNERLTVSQASLGIAILPAFSVAGRLLGALALDYIKTLHFTLAMILLQGASLLIIGSAQSVAMLYLGFAMFGGCVGNLLMLHPLIIAEVYGLKHYSRLFASSNMIMLCGVAAGPGVMGWLYGSTGGYTTPYWVAGICCLASTLVFLVIRPPVSQAS